MAAGPADPDSSFAAAHTQGEGAGQVPMEAGAGQRRAGADDAEVDMPTVSILHVKDRNGNMLLGSPASIDLQVGLCGWAVAFASCQRSQHCDCVNTVQPPMRASQRSDSLLASPCHLAAASVQA